MKTGETYELQDRFECLTCGISDSTGMCGACSKSCHAGHIVRAVVRARALLWAVLGLTSGGVHRARAASSAPAAAAAGAAA
jgi:hypothetical protein